jgi:hypothetical protein
LVGFWTQLQRDRNAPRLVAPHQTTRAPTRSARSHVRAAFVLMSSSPRSAPSGRRGDHSVSSPVLWQVIRTLFQ